MAKEDVIEMQGEVEENLPNATFRGMCRKCKVIRRKGVVRIICADPRHKQRQG